MLFKYHNILDFLYIKCILEKRLFGRYILPRRLPEDASLLPFLQHEYTSSESSASQRYQRTIFILQLEL